MLRKIDFILMYVIIIIMNHLCNRLSLQKKYKAYFNISFILFF